MSVTTGGVSVGTGACGRAVVGLGRIGARRGVMGGAAAIVAVIGRVGGFVMLIG